ncbi:MULTISPECIES: NACHT domain-containing protein [unclassified Tolypothrix]|uniref:NACHT domain-containing protein n=1 Tax=unclassified Tolypothrix TaxID=2649714 RepID=UPI0005EAA36B|nr:MULTISPECIES: NACHT domain-containing protein [unclassified Tolypothrix]BAY92641.1 putative signal transduction protein with Nacht domain [Microchaete diplosiphon NIES-3275]EKF05736.1 putative NACHT nucleoside [Tolypothrix sp. PCC 7601]MBE9083985.1 NACHT domain-containing protein [Tolypothrix sp. LEGE 11397]UYD26585.1 NACHT domain-containing protein [Tolypothrix sp. PCC 7712]UYD31177.1 NACHT domain-containing protein [Tolypothrix sp. PCC 7601]
MTRRSLQASAKGISKAEAALIRNSLTQQGLAGELGISRQPVTKFFQGKPVDRYIFVTICEKLNLNWEEIIISSSFPEVEQPASVSQMQSLVQILREKVHDSIQRRCGVMRVLDMEQPRRLDTIYTQVNIWQRVSAYRRLDIAEISRNFEPGKYNCFNLGSLQQPRRPALEAVESHDKLMILGKPGSGKTIFLKWLAIQCNLGEYRGDRVPIFIHLKDFAEAREQPNLLEYITEQFEECGVTISNAVLNLLTEGLAFVLLDGLDEIQDADFERVVRDIHRFTTRFYTNRFVITCRVAARKYIFEQFTEVEIADFDEQQMSEFVTKWFQEEASTKAEYVLHKLQENQSLQELANNPLLLTFLCLFFTEVTDFEQSEIYQEALNILIKQWNEQRYIQQNGSNQQISTQLIEELLSVVAQNTWDRREYFFKQEAIEKQICEYIQNLSDSKRNLNLAEIDSEALLKYIQAQNGLLVERAKRIYSFSHITFQQFLAGKHRRYF